MTGSKPRRRDLVCVIADLVERVPTARRRAAIFAMGKPVALDASALERLTRRIHFDHETLAGVGVDRELDVRAARLDPTRRSTAKASSRMA